MSFRALLTTAKISKCLARSDRLFIAVPNSTNSTRQFSSEKEEFISVVGDPKVRSPFDNPRRVKRATPVFGSAQAKYTTDDNKPDERSTSRSESSTSTRITETGSRTAKVSKDGGDGITARKGLSRAALAEHHARPVETTSAGDDRIQYDDPIRSYPIEFASTHPSSSANEGLMRRIKNSVWSQIPDDLPEDEKKRRKRDRGTKVGMVVVSVILTSGFVWFCFQYGRAKRDEHGNVIPDEFSGSWLASFYRIANSLKLWKDYVVEPSRELLLPDPLPAPYHQPKYTLVVEIKNVLVAPEWTYKTGYRFKKRPALDYFLDVVGYPNFEVVVYTSEPSMTTPPIVESMDPKHRIMYKLYRDCTKYMNGHHVKDLSRLNRDLSKVIYIDFDPNSFQLNPENVLRMPKWDGDMEDTALVDLAELLKTIHLSDVDDVRPTLQYYSQFDDPTSEFRRRAQYVAQQEAHKAEEDQQSTLKKYSGKLFGFRRHQAI